MTFFNTLFGNTNKKQKAPEPMVDRNLFVADDAPEMQMAKNLEPLSQLGILMALNFEMQGYSDGYSEHNVSIMQAKIQTVIADFRQAFSAEIDKIDIHLRSIEPHLCDAVKEAMPSEYLNLSSKYSDLTTKKSEMQAQYELATNGEGKCEPALSKYRLGFQKGYSLWTDENLLRNTLNQ